MWRGSVVSIHISPEGRGSMSRVEEIHAFAGRGLDGDRYFKKTGTYSKKHGPDREITLIEVEAIEALKRDYGVDLDPGQSRRNIVTRGAALNHLVGQEFNIGKVRLRGIRLCEPCGHLASLSGKEVVPGLVHRGGLRAQILTDGLIRTSDPIEIANLGFRIAD